MALCVITMKKRNLNVQAAKECAHLDTIVGCLLSTGTCNRNCSDFTTYADDVTFEPFQLSGKHISILRGKLLTAQGNKCLICEVHLSSNDGAACLDHHHQKKNKGTGLIRGVLCRTCNSLVAKNENNATRFRIEQARLPNILRKIAGYLEKPQYPYLHPSEKPKIKKLKKDSYNRLIKAMKLGKEKKIPVYPPSGKVTVLLESMYKKYNLVPEFYK